MLIEVFKEAGLDLTVPLVGYGDYLLRLLQLQAIIFLLGFGLRYTFKIVTALTRGSFF